MHELGIAQSIYSIALRELHQRQKRRVRKIALRIGVWSGVMPEALAFSFSSLIQETPLQGAELEIVEAPLQAHCQNCQKTFAIAGLMEIKCPHCHSTQLKLAGGDEMEIAYIEME